LSLAGAALSFAESSFPKGGRKMNEHVTGRTRGIDAIIPEMAGYGSEFAKTYANHAPMVLVAMHYMGGSDERLRDFFENYRMAKRLFPFAAEVQLLDRDNWQEAIGQREREADLRRFFTAELGRVGIQAALLTYLPRLSPGIGASALHGLMRLAYALMRMDAAEVANALAYWAATYLELPASTASAPITGDPAEVLARVSEIGRLHELPLQELLWHNIRLVAQQPEFASVVDWLAITPDTPRRLAAASLALFASTQSFCALHAVTGMHWLRIVMPFCSTPDVMMRHFWQCIAALMGEMHFPTLPSAEQLEEWRQVPVPDWPEIFAAAVASYDEHDLSLTFTASQEQKVYGDPLYQLVAAQRVGLVPFAGDPANRLVGRTMKAA
jgi:hypothetical protein